MLAAGQYGAMFFAGYPHRMDRFMGFLPIACPCKDADIPRFRQSSSTGLRAGLFLGGEHQTQQAQIVMWPHPHSVIPGSAGTDGKLRVDMTHHN
ncbi:hypothetical protein A6U94_05070 [Agrobacterium tumefaciens]|nr:hypothetical protein A6U94_05070 [Agrobacterium tumefaciens]